MKRGIAEHTFIFIFALIVVAMILVWGTSTILKLKDTAGQVQLADSIEDVKEKAIVYYNLEAESSAPLNIRFPNGVECVCFLNKRHNLLKIYKQNEQQQKFLLLNIHIHQYIPNHLFLINGKRPLSKM